MPLTLEELKEKIVDLLDEVTVMEILDIKTQDLVDRFEDKIDERFDSLSRELLAPEEGEDSEKEDSI